MKRDSDCVGEPQFCIRRRLFVVKLSECSKGNRILRFVMCIIHSYAILLHMMHSIVIQLSPASGPRPQIIQLQKLLIAELTERIKRFRSLFSFFLPDKQSKSLLSTAGERAHSRPRERTGRRGRNRGQIGPLIKSYQLGPKAIFGNTAPLAVYTTSVGVLK